MNDDVCSVADGSVKYDNLDQCLNDSIYENYTIRSMLSGHNKNKQQKVGHLKPIIFSLFQTNLGVPKTKYIKCLCDSGSDGTIMFKGLGKELQRKVEPQQNWNTAAGTFKTNGKCKIQFKLPELAESKVIEYTVHLSDKDSKYDMIIGNDLLSVLKIHLNYEDMTVEWDEHSTPMKSTDTTATEPTCFAIEDSVRVQDSLARIKKILDAKYEPANLNEIVEDCSHLEATERHQLFELLKEYEDLFDGTLGKWKCEDYKIDLKEGAKPYHAKPFPIPQVHEGTLKLEVDSLCALGVLKKINHSEWGAPTFIIPKKDGTVRFISDFRELNKRIKRKPYPVPKVQDLLQKLEGFKYSTSLDLNMGYYHIELNPDAKKLCTIVLPWGKYEHQRLPMGLCTSVDLFQEKMSTLMADLEYVRAYIDDLLIITKASFEDHLNKLETVFQRLQDKGLKVNAKKCSWVQDQLEYLGYIITRDGIQPILKKVEAILKLKPPTTKKELRSFIGMVNYYHDMWPKRSELLAPLTALTSLNTKWEWTDEHQKAFEAMKKNISKNTLLTYPDFNKQFVIHTDASHTQLGAVISQDGKPLAFYSWKLNPAQCHYTTTERELLAIVETLKEFRNILLGQNIKIYTDHKNLTYKNFNTERVMWWHLIIEEYAPEFEYLQGPDNIVADALSCLDSDCTMLLDEVNIAEHLSLNIKDLPDDFFPVSYNIIHAFQQKDKTLQAEVKHCSSLSIHSFHGGATKYPLICQNEKIYIPKLLQQRIVK